MNDQLGSSASLDWPKLEGIVLEGGYEIQDLVAADQSSRTFKIRVLGDASAHLLTKVFLAAGGLSNEQVALWNKAKDFQHPNLIAPTAAGRTQVDGTEFIYVIVERPEEVLDDILRERPLNAEEAGEVLVGAARALEYLHARGFAHGCVSPRQVFAVGESIKLSCESIRGIGVMPSRPLVSPKYRAPESEPENVTPEADVWCLGATLFETLTQNECGDECREQAAKLPGAFARIVPRSLDPDPAARYKASELPALYRGRESVTLTPELTRAPELEETSALPRVAPARQLGVSRRIWIYAAFAVLAVLASVWLLRSKHPNRSSDAVAVPSPTPNTQKPAPATTAGALPAPSVHPENTATTPPAQRHLSKEVTGKATKQAPNTVNGPIWRVVLYTYSRVEDAQNMAHSINAKYRQLSADVFTPSGQNTAYLVVVGGRMNYDQAARLRRRVLSMGLPRDSYVQNYSQ